MAEQSGTSVPSAYGLGDLLVQQKLISQEQLRGALEDQSRSGRKLGRVLDRQRVSLRRPDRRGARAPARRPVHQLKYYNFNSAVTRKLPEAQARRFRALLLEEQDDMVLVAMVDPTDLFAFDEIARLTRKEVNIAVVSETLLLQTIDRIYRRTEQITSLAKELGEDLGETAVDLGALTLGAEDAPVVKLIQTMFEDAVQARGRTSTSSRMSGGCHPLPDRRAAAAANRDRRQDLRRGGAADQADVGARHIGEAPAARRPVQRKS